MLLADNTSQYVVPASSVLVGSDCSLCKKVINPGSMPSGDSDLTWHEADGLVLTTSIESGGDTILSHAHISCIQGLVNEVPSVYMEFEDLRNSYLEAVG